MLSERKPKAPAISPAKRDSDAHPACRTPPLRPPRVVPGWKGSITAPSSSRDYELTNTRTYVMIAPASLARNA